MKVSFEINKHNTNAFMSKFLYILIITLISLSNGFGQIKLSEIPYKIENINKRDYYGKQGIWCFYSNSTMIVNSIWYYKNDTLDGFFEDYGLKGILSSKGFYKKGVLDSVYIAYWENGKIRVFSNNKDGFLNGLTTCYNSTGKMIYRKNYINGIEDSTYSESYVDSNLILENVSHRFEKESDKIDTISYKYPPPYNKSLEIFKNDTIVKVIDFYKDRVYIESLYENGILIKRIVYSKRSPYSVKKTHNYINGKYSNTEILQKRGKKLFVKKIIL
jgi:hypothetical protein